MHSIIDQLGVRSTVAKLLNGRKVTLGQLFDPCVQLLVERGRRLLTEVLDRVRGTLGQSSLVGGFRASQLWMMNVLPCAVVLRFELVLIVEGDERVAEKTITRRRARFRGRDGL